MIFTEDVEKIFGKRQWTSRTDEILAANQTGDTAHGDSTPSDDNSGDDKVPADTAPSMPESSDGDDGVTPPTPPPFKGLGN